MSELVAKSLTVNSVDLKIFLSKHLHSEVVFFNCAIGLAKVSNVVDKFVVKLGHDGSGGDGSECSKSEGSHKININYLKYPI